MISVVIATLNDERTLGELLSALVPAVVDGLVRDVIVADGGSTDQTLDIAEDAGVRVMASDASAEDRIAEGCRAAKSDWLLVLDVAAPLPIGWDRAVAAHLRTSTDAGWWGRKWLWRAEPKGVLMPRAVFVAAGARVGPRAMRLKI